MSSIHKPIGLLLGYQCPENMSKLEGQRLYDISYQINKKPQLQQLGCYCKLNHPKNILDAIERLNIIKESLTKIGISDVSLKVELIDY